MKHLTSRLFMLTVLLSPVVALPPLAWAQRGDSVYVEDRLNQLQQSITILTGQIEQLQYQNQQLQHQLEKMQADYEFRIDQLEKGKGGGGRPPGAPAPAVPGGPPRNAAAPGAPAAAAAAAAAPSANADQLYHDAFKLFQDGDYAGAERGFKAFVQRNPQHVLASNAQYWLGESYYARADYQNAMVAFAEGYKTYKNTAKGPDNLLKLGITLSRLGKKQEACTMFARFNQDYPKATDLQKRRVDGERQKNSCG
jgi:tol-pal system protein YbgF